jgi:hypothetical protein
MSSHYAIFTVERAGGWNCIYEMLELGVETRENHPAERVIGAGVATETSM